VRRAAYGRRGRSRARAAPDLEQLDRGSGIEGREGAARRADDQMAGYVVVVPTPYFATTNSQGEFEIKDVPPGSYTLKTWSEEGKPSTQSVTVSGESTSVNLTVSK